MYFLPIWEDGAVRRRSLGFGILVGWAFSPPFSVWVWTNRPAEDVRPIMLEKRVENLIGPTIEDMGFELVRAAIMRQDSRLQVMVERATAPAFVDDCADVSRAISAVGRGGPHRGPSRGQLSGA